jgi:hypothetical protein
MRMAARFFISSTRRCCGDDAVLGGGGDVAQGGGEGELVGELVDLVGGLGEQVDDLGVAVDPLQPAVDLALVLGERGREVDVLADPEADLIDRLGDDRRVLGVPDVLGGGGGEVGEVLLDPVEARLDLLHRVDVLDLALLAGGDDQALGRDGLIRGLLLLADLEELAGGHALLGLLGGDLEVDVDEGAQALVLAEVAAGALVALLAEGDGVDLVEADPAGRWPRSLVHAPDLEGGADRPRLAAVLVHDHVGLDALGGEALLDEVDLRLDGRQVVLGAALEHEALPSLARLGIWLTYSQMFLGSTLARPAMISSGAQPWRWKSTMSDCMNTAQP